MSGRELSSARELREENARLLTALKGLIAALAPPVETLAGQIQAKRYAELTNDLQDSLLVGVGALRMAAVIVGELQREKDGGRDGG